MAGITYTEINIQSRTAPSTKLLSHLGLMRLPPKACWTRERTCSQAFSDISATACIDSWAKMTKKHPERTGTLVFISSFAEGLSCSPLCKAPHSTNHIYCSCTKWSSGHETEHSIANAYIEVIHNAEHFVYIENQVDTPLFE